VKSGSHGNVNSPKEKSKNSISPNGKVSRRVATVDPSIKYVPPKLAHDVHFAQGVVIRRSQRWLDCAPCAQQRLPIPLINDVGKNTGLTLYEWHANLPSHCATVCSTISSRLMSYARRHNPSKTVCRFARVIARISAYYYLTWNNYLMDRILYFLRNLEVRGKLIHQVLLKFVAKLDVYKRFVYSQASYQANWLLFRAQSGPRDKSKFKVKLGGPISEILKDSSKGLRQKVKFKCMVANAILGSIYNHA